MQYTVIKDSNTTILKGYISRTILEKDTTSKWFKENMRYGTPNQEAVNAFAKNKDAFSLIVFGGTWCEDTQNLLPRLYQLTDKSGFPENKIQLIAVDQQKQTILNLHTKYAIQNVPTFIVIQNGKEVGRVVEYGTIGDITKELGAIVQRLSSL